MQEDFTVHLSEQELSIENAAIEFARKNKTLIARRLAGTALYSAEDEPVSVFMAGSPGAGKTEASLALLESFESNTKILRIDPDDLRKEFAEYVGANSYLFQKAVSIIVDRLHDIALQQKQSFLLDGTLSNYERAQKNIARSLSRGRLVQVLYVYQDPMLAWGFVRAREMVEGRKILLHHFIEQYFTSRDTVIKLKKHFGEYIQVDVLIKDRLASGYVSKISAEEIDTYVPEKYTKEQLQRDLSLAIK